jgi:hypothetical protein
MTKLVGFAVALALIAALGAPISSASARPGWASPNECLLDDGYNRYRPCNSGDGA